nr:hypothetical protein [Tanacetum cinerariifolium]
MSKRVFSVWATRLSATKGLVFRFFLDVKQQQGIDRLSATKGLVFRFFFGRQTAARYRQVKVLEFFDFSGPREESGYKLRLVAGIATSALVNGGSQSEVPAPVKVAAYWH